VSPPCEKPHPSSVKSSFLGAFIEASLAAAAYSTVFPVLLGRGYSRSVDDRSLYVDSSLTTILS